MSEHNYFALTVKAQLEKDPSVLTVTDGDIKRIEQNAAKLRAQRDAAAPPPGKADLQKEYNQLRQQLFNLKQDAKCYEQRCNDAAGKVRILEQRITDLIKLKKDAAAENNLRGERTHEQGIQRLEAELLDAQEEFEKNKRYSGQAARALKAFDGHARIEELKCVLDGVSPDAKSAHSGPK
jgi:DNA repair exonuclease SbcCD ATPase subunit